MTVTPADMKAETITRLTAKVDELRARLASPSETGESLLYVAREIAEVEEWVERIREGVPCCRSCGSTSFRAWYPVDEGQGIDIERLPDGTLTYDYDGDTEAGESGADSEFWCRGCQDHSTSLEALVGDEAEPVEIASPTIEELQRACEYDAEGDSSVDALIAYKDALEDAYGTLLEKGGRNV